MSACPHIPTEAEYLNCIRCGLCLSVCPTYRESLVETASPRGRLALVRRYVEGKIPPSRKLSGHLSGCLTCLACDEICPVGIRPAQLVRHMRQAREQEQPSMLKAALWETLIFRPAVLEATTLPLRLYESSGLRKSMAPLAGFLPDQFKDLEAMLPPLPKRPLRRTLRSTQQAEPQEAYQVGFFLGCAQSLLFAEQSAASLRVLRRNGCSVVVPRDSVCCGMPASTYGRVDLARRLAQHNIAAFEGAGSQIIVTDCATCGSMLKEYTQLLAQDPAWAERATAFSSKVRDISEFLSSIPLAKPTQPIPARVTYHDPCHLRRGQGVWRQPRQLLNIIDGLELVELPESNWCCGSAGSQLLTHHKTSTRILDRKMGNLKGTRAAYIASGCQMQLNAGVRRERLQVQVVHPIQLLDQAYGLGADS